MSISGQRRVGLQFGGQGAVVLGADVVLAHGVGCGEVAAVAGPDDGGSEVDSEVCLAPAGSDRIGIRSEPDVAEVIECWAVMVWVCARVLEQWSCGGPRAASTTRWGLHG